MLRNPEPTALAAARALAHRAVQWPARAARANLEPVPDDSHTSLSWDPIMAALLSQPLKGGARVGLRLAVHELVFTKGKHTEACALAGKPDAEAGEWLDARLAAEGLKPASEVKLSYDMPPTLFARPADEAPRLAALAVWFAAGAELLEELRKKYQRLKPGPVRCRPHHFDIASVVELGGGRAIGIGLSPGDELLRPALLLPEPVSETGDRKPAAAPAGRPLAHEGLLRRGGSRHRPPRAPRPARGAPHDPGCRVRGKPGNGWFVDAQTGARRGRRWPDEAIPDLDSGDLCPLDGELVVGVRKHAAAGTDQGSPGQARTGRYFALRYAARPAATASVPAPGSRTGPPRRSR